VRDPARGPGGARRPGSASVVPGGPPRIARHGAAALLAALTLPSSLVGVPRVAAGAEAARPPSGTGSCFAAPDTLREASTPPPEFYAIDLVPTGRVTGTGAYRGKAEVRFAASPFDVALAEDGTFHRRVRVDMRGLRAAPHGDYVVWAAPPDLDPVVKLGPLGDDMTLTGEVAFPKFLLVVSLEEDPEGVTGKWSGPIVHRGMSRSGFMHTMAGHGPFQSEPCASYGFQ